MLRHTGVACAIAAIAGIGCGGETEKEPVTIGLSASLTGFDSQWGQTVRDIVVATVAEINDNGGIDGHELVVEIADDGSETDTAPAAFEELIAADVAGIVGPFWSGQTGAVVPLLVDAQIPTISPSATAVELITSPPDDGYLFRTTPNDGIQVLAMAHYLDDLAGVSSIAVVHEAGDYGEGLAADLIDTWQTRGQSVTGTAIDFPGGLDQLGAIDVWEEIAAANPSTVVVVSGGSDANLLIRAWNDSGELPDLQWFLGDAAKQSALFDNEQGLSPLPTTVAAQVQGTAPTYPIAGLAFGTFVDVIDERLGIDVSQEAYFPNTWDAVYLLAAALLQQAHAGEEFGGPGLRDAIAAVSSGGQTYHAGQWRDIVGQINAGANVDYDGAAGPVDFDADGETISPYEVWGLEHDGADWTFVQLEYMEAEELTGD